MASRQASARGAPDAAAQLADLARDLTPADEAEARIHRTIHAGQFAFESGELGKAAACLEDAIAATSAGPFRAEALLFLARVRYHSHDAGSALALAEQALEEVGDDELLSRISSSSSRQPPKRSAIAPARAPMPARPSLAEAVGDDATLAEALALVAFHDFVAGEGDPRDTMGRALELEGAAVSIRPLRSPTFRQACLSMWMDELDAARSIFVDLTKRCREGGDEGSLAVMLFMLAQVECSAGNWSEAGAYADESCEITAWTGHLPYRSLALSAKAMVEGHLGRADSARATASEGWISPDDPGWCRRVSSTSRRWGSSRCRWTIRRKRTASCGPSPRARSPPASESRACFGSCRMRSRPSSRSARRTRRASILEPFAARAGALDRTWALATSERGWGLLNASIGELPDAARRVRARHRVTTRRSMSRSSSVERSWHRVKRFAA